MKFIYEYKTHENEKREGVISAPSRDAVYVELKKKGIRPFRVVLAPGFLNRIQSIGKRGFAIVALSSVAVVATWAAIWYKEAASSQSRDAEVEARSQIYGDPTFIAECVSKGWGNVFALEGERILATFAEPGKGVKPVSGAEAERAIVESLTNDIAFVAGEDEVSVKCKRIVNGMKVELRRYLEDGGTAGGYLIRLAERQREEIAFRLRVQNEINAAVRDDRDVERVWTEKNEVLRTMGLMLVPMPKIRTDE